MEAPTEAPTEAPKETPAAETPATSSEMPDLGAGCCSKRDPATMLYKGMQDDLAACKAKCASIADCGFIEYGWKDSKWCTVISKDTDCSELADGALDCGAGGGDNGVHTYEMLESEAPGETGAGPEEGGAGATEEGFEETSG